MVLIVACIDQICFQCGPRAKKSCPPLSSTCCETNFVLKRTLSGLELSCSRPAWRSADKATCPSEAKMTSNSLISEDICEEKNSSWTSKITGPSPEPPMENSGHLIIEIFSFYTIRAKTTQVYLKKHCFVSNLTTITRTWESKWFIVSLTYYCKICLIHYVCL